ESRQSKQVRWLGQTKIAGQRKVPGVACDLAPDTWHPAPLLRFKLVQFQTTYLGIKAASIPSVCGVRNSELKTVLGDDLGLFGLPDLLGQLQLDIDRDLVAYQPAAGLEGDIPVQPPVLAVELGLGVKPGAGRAPGSLGLASVLDIQHHLFGD